MFRAVKDMFKREEVTDPQANAWHRQCELTPDIWKLEQSKYQLVFIADDMMTGKVNHSLISDALLNNKPVHPCCYTFERYTMFKKDLGDLSFCIPMKKDYEPSNWLRTRPYPVKIKGELHAILSPRIIKLDIHRQNGLQFRRERQQISLPFRHVHFDAKHPLPKISQYYLKTVEAWMYTGVPEYWDNLIGDMYNVGECDKFTLVPPQFWTEEYYKF